MTYNDYNGPALPTDITPVIARFSLPIDRALPRIPARLLYTPRPTPKSPENNIRHLSNRHNKVGLQKSKRASLVAAKDLERRLELSRPQLFNKAEGLLLDIYSLGDDIEDINFAYEGEKLCLIISYKYARTHTYSGPAVEAARSEIIKYALSLNLNNPTDNED